MKLLKVLKNNAFMLSYVAKYTPGFFFWTIVEGIIWGCIHSFTSVLFVKTLFDKIGRGEPFSGILTVILTMAAFLILAYLFHEWYWVFLESKARQQLHERMQSELYKKAAGLDLECYDNPNFYNDFVWAISEADSRAIKVAEDMGKIINRVISTAAIIGVLLSVDILIVLAICFSVSLTVFLKLRKTRIQLDRDTEIKPEQRKSDYIGRVFYLSDYAKELRLSNAQQVLTDKFDESSQSIVKSLKSYGSRLFLLGTTRSICTSMLFDIGITVLLTYKMMVQNAISLGDFAASVAGTWKLFWQINNLMEYITGLYEHSLYAERFRTFLSYKARVADTEASEDIGEPFSGLSVNNLSFTYPGSESAALSDISLSVRPGEKIAFVGYNGAGKSTLIKLLLRLYDPDAGEIRMNGRDIKDYAIRSYRSKFGAVFQDYRIYAATVAENVLADLYNESNEAQVIKALHLSGFDGKLSGLKNGIFTPLTKEFDKDGEILSSGEAQKIAIARAFAQLCEIMILDEPSSALDPAAEYELNEAMISLARGKTVIFISHRLSTTRMADRIYMFEKGRIIEQGSHDELIRLGGKYAEMFTLQAEKYVNGGMPETMAQNAL